MVKAVFLDFYKTLYFHRRTLEENLRRIVARYGVELNWEHFETAQERLFAGTAVFDPATYSLMESLMTTVKRECEFIRELGIQEHAEQMAWELLQSGHFLFAANSAALYSDVIPTLQRLRDIGFKLAIVSNWESPLDPLTERLEIAKYFDAVLPHMMCASGLRNRIHISSTMHSQRSVFPLKRSFMLEIPTKRILWVREMWAFVQYSLTAMEHKLTDGKRRFGVLLNCQSCLKQMLHKE